MLILVANALVQEMVDGLALLKSTGTKRYTLTQFLYDPELLFLNFLKYWENIWRRTKIALLKLTPSKFLSVVLLILEASTDPEPNIMTPEYESLKGDSRSCLQWIATDFSQLSVERNFLSLHFQIWK